MSSQPWRRSSESDWCSARSSSHESRQRRTSRSSAAMETMAMAMGQCKGKEPQKDVETRIARPCGDANRDEEQPCEQSGADAVALPPSSSTPVQSDGRRKSSSPSPSPSPKQRRREYWRTGPRGCASVVVAAAAAVVVCCCSPTMAAYLGNKLVQMGTKIVGVGRNYAAHAKELGAAIPKEPLLFLKPTSSYIREGSSVEIPSSCTFLDHEVELAVVIGKKGRDIQESHAMDHISGYALALDMTARELQAIAKKQGLPWLLAKGYDTFTPIGKFIPKKQVRNPSDLELWLEVDGQLKQKGNTNDMIFSIPVLVSYISTIMTLKEGDTILTGTPSGVGPVKAGQRMKAGITGLAEMSFDVKARKPLR